MHSSLDTSSRKGDGAAMGPGTSPALVQSWLQFIITLHCSFEPKARPQTPAYCKKRVFLRESWAAKKYLIWIHCSAVYLLGHLPAPVVFWSGVPPGDIGEVVLRVSPGLTEPNGSRCQSPGPGCRRLKGGWAVGVLHSPLSSSQMCWGGLFPSEKLNHSEAWLCYGNKSLPNLSLLGNGFYFFLMPCVSILCELGTLFHAIIISAPQLMKQTPPGTLPISVVAGERGMAHCSLVPETSP